MKNIFLFGMHTLHSMLKMSYLLVFPIWENIRWFFCTPRRFSWKELLITWNSLLIFHTSVKTKELFVYRTGKFVLYSILVFTVCRRKKKLSIWVKGHWHEKNCQIRIWGQALGLKLEPLSASSKYFWSSP
jgi:hypothetical protein